MRIIVTGSSGLIGSEAVLHFARAGHQVVGIDNNLRRHFFGPDGDTTPVLTHLRERLPGFVHLDEDIRDRAAMLRVIDEYRPDVIIHCAAQPSHDLAARLPFEDFDTNAGGTFNLLEATRRGAPEAVFVFMSTNKVYGDGPNRVPLVELPTRWDFAAEADQHGIAETFSIDGCLHSLFGASKVAADVTVQEYGRYFGLRTGVFRGGCLTGVNHAAAELHGYLAYLFKAAAEGREYTIHGYQGKQVRDQIHSADVVQAIELFIADPRPGEVYNLGGGRANSVSMLESIARIEELLDVRLAYRYSEQNRTGDHICYYTDLRKLQAHYPSFRITRTLDAIFEEFAAVWRRSMAS
ncbi:MAG: NAD-dependent epimerase/dehydratase family protein [Polyangiales bacterium]